MVKMRGPLLSISAWGWLGRYNYKIDKVVVNPYPISLLGRIRLWDRVTSLGTVNKYFVPAFGLRPYPGFIFQYYSVKGWCYTRRRTWHGIIPTAIRPPISAQPNTALQNAYKQRFADAVAAWQSMNPATKDLYHHWRYPVRASGYNRFISWYLKHTPVSAIGPSYILLEDGGKILTEASENLIQES
jgi:hypothetical protein